VIAASRDTLVFWRMLFPSNIENLRVWLILDALCAFSPIANMWLRSCQLSAGMSTTQAGTAKGRCCRMSRYMRIGYKHGLLTLSSQKRAPPADLLSSRQRNLAHHRQSMNKMDHEGRLAEGLEHS
jgi:hypothetical protein